MKPVLQNLTVMISFLFLLTGLNGCEEPGTITVSVSPTSTNLGLGETQQFTATVTGAEDQEVLWSVDEGFLWGSISAEGLYTAPTEMPISSTATIRATSVSDPFASATATVTIVQGSSDSFNVDAFNYEDPRPEEFHPLSRKVMNLVKSQELAVLAPDSDRGITGRVIDDKKNDYGEMGTIGDGAAPFDGENEELWATVSADFDGDGREEIAVASIYTAGDDGSSYLFLYKYIRITILDYEDGSFSVTGRFTIGEGDNCYLVAKLAAGDVDGDGKHELIVAGMLGRYQSRPSVYKSVSEANVFVYDDAQSSFALLKAMEFEGGDVDVTTGDIDGDEVDELLVSGLARDYYNTANYFLGFDAWAYDDHSTGYAELKHWGVDNVFYRSGDYDYQSAVRCGDIDGDGVDEIIFLGQNGNHVYACDDATESGGFARMDSFYLEQYGANFAEGDFYTPQERFDAAVADTNGDGMEELVVLVKTEDDYYGGFGPSGTDIALRLYHYAFNNDTARFYNEQNEFVIYEPYSTYYSGDVLGRDLAVLDDDRDGNDEIVVTWAESSYYESNVKRTRIASTFKSNYYFLEEAGTWSDEVGGEPSNPMLVAGDFDGDNMKVEYTGEHWLSLPDPMIIVAMAAAPAQDGIIQNVDETETAYGTAVSEGTSETHEVGVSAGVTLSFEAGDPFNIIEASASVTLETEFTKTDTTAEMTTYGTSLAGNFPYDYVIFQGTLYNCYEYRILAHPDPEVVGTSMSIDVPVKTKVFKWTVDFFNDNNGYGRDIGAETFMHTPGDVASYPSIDDKDAIMAQYTGWQTAAMSVGQGNSQSTTYISLAEEQTTGESLSIGVSTSAGLKVGGVGMEFSVGYSNTDIYEITIGSETSYEGTVGDIEAANWTDYNYDFGMFVYNFTRDDGMSYQVINYWVEGLGQGYNGL